MEDALAQVREKLKNSTEAVDLIANTRKACFQALSLWRPSSLEDLMLSQRPAPAEAERSPRKWSIELHPVMRDLIVVTPESVSPGAPLIVREHGASPT